MDVPFDSGTIGMLVVIVVDLQPLVACAAYRPMCSVLRSKQSSQSMLRTGMPVPGCFVLAV